MPVASAIEHLPQILLFVRTTLNGTTSTARGNPVEGCMERLEAQWCWPGIGSVKYEKYDVQSVKTEMERRELGIF